MRKEENIGCAVILGIGGLLELIYGHRTRPLEGEEEGVYRYMFCRDHGLLRVGTSTQRSSELRGPRSSVQGWVDDTVVFDGIVRDTVNCTVSANHQMDLLQLQPITRSDKIPESKGKSGRPLRPGSTSSSMYSRYQVIAGISIGDASGLAGLDLPVPCYFVTARVCRDGVARRSCFSFLVSRRHLVSLLDRLRPRRIDPWLSSISTPRSISSRRSSTPFTL